MINNYASIVFILLVAICSLSCSQNLYRYTLVPDGKTKTIRNVHGSYIEVESTTNLISGELLAMDDDTMYILSAIDLEVVAIRSIDKIQITLADTRTRRYLAWGSAVTLPSIIGAVAHQEFSSGFIALGGITAGLSLIAVLIEASRKPHLITFPGDIIDIRSLSKYARFPFGLPPGVIRTDATFRLELE